MLYLITAVIFLALTIGGMIVRKTYLCLPVGELKRRARRRDPTAAKLYRAVAYGSSLRGLLWLFIALTSSTGFVLLARIAPVWLSLLAVASLLWVVYSWLPGRRVTPFGTRLTLLVTPAVTWLLNYLYPVLDRADGLLERHVFGHEHTGLFERSDLLALVDRQSKQADSRMSEAELEAVKRALSFEERQVGDTLTHARNFKSILTSDIIGPVLINELYQQGQEFVLVRETTNGPIVGLLESKRLNVKSTGRVRDLMNPAVCYLHEDDSLSEALHAFFMTNSPLFVVVNSSKEYLGVVSVQNIVQALLGYEASDDFDQYTDLDAVAARHTPVVSPVKEPEGAEGEEVIELA